jgi:hypothetical protein
LAIDHRRSIVRRLGSREKQESKMSTNQERRKELKEQARQTAPEAGVYGIRNTETGRMLIASSRNLKNVANRIVFAKSTNATTFFGHRISNDVKTYGIQAFTFEPIETLSIRPDMTTAQLDADLKALEELVLLRFDPADLY